MEAPDEYSDDETDLNSILENPNSNGNVEVLPAEPLDKYGFSGRHPYVPTQSDLLYNKEEVERTPKWVRYLKKWEKNPSSFNKSKEKFKNKVYRGIPDSVRGPVWLWMMDVRSAKAAHPKTYFSDLLQKRAQKDTEEQIEKDLKRTFPNHVQFKGDTGQRSLYRVLHAFACHNPKVGYCQGMGFVVALLLMYIPEEDNAFWLLTQIGKWNNKHFHGFLR